MTYSPEERQANCKRTLDLMLQVLGDDAVAETVFSRDGSEFADTFPTTWTDLRDKKWLEEAEVSGQYRLTGVGWLQALRITGRHEKDEFKSRLRETFASMKSFVKGRQSAAIVKLGDLARRANVPEGWLFNVIESRLMENFHGRKGPHFDKRMVVIPAEFAMLPINLDSLLAGEVESRINELQEQLEEAREQLKEYQCPYCASALSSSGPVPLSERDEGYFETFECGYSRLDGLEQRLCPSDPKYPSLGDFELRTERVKDHWVCLLVPKTANAWKIDLSTEIGTTEEEARRRVVERYRFRKGEIKWDE